jgi:CheY-like chemotaxis protein
MARRPPHKCILIVDDEDIAREAMAKLLQWKGYQTRCSANGREALTHLPGNPPIDLVLLDLWMEGGDGWEFRDAQRQDPALAGIPVVVLSAVGDAAEWADNLGDVGYLRKPIKADELFTAVERFTFSPKPEVLLVERDPDHTRAAEKVLRHHGFAVRMANDEQQAVDLFRQHAGTTTAVLLDADKSSTLDRLRQVDAEVRCYLMSPSRESQEPSAAGAVRVFEKSADGLAEMPQVLWEIVTKSAGHNHVHAAR